MLVCLPGTEGEVYVDPSVVLVVEQLAAPGPVHMRDGIRISAGFTDVRLSTGRTYTIEATAEEVMRALWPEGAA